MTHLMFLLSNSRIAGGVKPAQQKQHMGNAEGSSAQPWVCLQSQINNISTLHLLLCGVLLACLLVTET